MAPEAWRGRSATTQTDVYSLGAMLYELCTGHPPHRAETLSGLALAVATSEPKPTAVAAPAVDARLAAVIDRCLQRDPQRRFESAEQVREALERIAVKSSLLSRRVVMAGGSLIVILFTILAGVTVARDRRAKQQAKQQAELAQRLGQELGQEIKDMEWTLRSARQLPLHNLNNEKDIVRKRMAQFEARLLSYGDLGRGLAHYALGRGHLALHEYPKALSELEQAMQLGYRSADAYYALGLVLGLHYKQAKEELRCKGPPSWVKKRLKPLESLYLTHAIEALQRSREMKLEAPHYLEGLIAFYQGDYDSALRNAQAARIEAPWLYEAATLEGDIYRERDTYSKNQGAGGATDRELINAVRSYEAAAAIGRSDAEVYENLTGAWASRVYFALTHRQPAALLYAAAVEASDKSIRAEPESILGPLKRTQAAQFVLPLLEEHTGTADGLKECLLGSQEVLKKQPTHLVATHFAAVCHLMAADVAEQRGENNEPLLRKAIDLLEAVVRKDPNYFAARNDLTITYISLAEHLSSRGNPEAKRCIEKGLEYAHEAAALDEEVSWPLYSALRLHAMQTSTAASEQELRLLLGQVDAEFAAIKTRGKQDTHTKMIHAWAYANAALRTYLAGQDAQPRLQVAADSLAQAQKLGNDMPDLEQVALLIHYVDASSRVRRKQDPGPALAEIEEARKRCLAMNAQDAPCQTTAAKAGWVESEWLAQKNQPIAPALQRALQRAVAATQSKEQTADAWQVLAEAHLRLLPGVTQPAERSRHVAAGLLAIQKTFAINPNHALGLATQGALLLARAQSERDMHTQQSTVREALAALEKAIQSDPLVENQYTPALETARKLVARPAP
jgi:serine/threonine-protein kinase